MNWLPTLVVLILVALFLREFVTVLRARVPAKTHLALAGKQAPACSDDIPKILWTWWPTKPTPAFVQACQANWRRFAPDHELRLLDRDSLTQWLPALRADFDALPAQRQADWLRVQLLTRHGGVWMDATTPLSRDLGWLHDLRGHSQAEYVGFYLERDTPQPEQPAIESWFMASVPGGSFVTALAEALDGTATTSLSQAASDLLTREPQAHRLALLRAEDGPSAWAAAVNWRKRRHYARIALTHAPTLMPALLRLREDDYALAERNWRKGRWLAGSALIELLGTPP